MLRYVFPDFPDVTYVKKCRFADRSDLLNHNQVVIKHNTNISSIFSRHNHFISNNNRKQRRQVLSALRLDTDTAHMTAESLNFWLIKFVLLTLCKSKFTVLEIS